MGSFTMPRGGRMGTGRAGGAMLLRAYGGAGGGTAGGVSAVGGSAGAGAVGTAGGGGGTAGGGTTPAGIKDLLDMFTSQYEESRAAKEKRYEGGLGILEEVAGMFGPGYLKGEETKTLAAMEQGMVGRGLGGTTRPAAVGTGIKADIRDRATKGRAGAMTNIAQYMSGYQETAPTPGTLASLATSMEAIKSGVPSAPPALIGTGTGSEPGGPAYMAGAANLMNPVQQTGPTTGPGPGVASQTISFGPSAQPATGAGAATYGVTGGLTPWQQQQASESWWRGVQ